MWQQLINWLENHLVSCTFQKYFGIACPGCGIQGSFIELLKGNFLESFKQYPALIPMLLILILLVLHLKFKFTWGAIALKTLFIISVSLIIIPYLYKISSPI